jgi:hypothetical protein
MDSSTTNPTYTCPPDISTTTWNSLPSSIQRDILQERNLLNPWIESTNTRAVEQIRSQITESNDGNNTTQDNNKNKQQSDDLSDEEVDLATLHRFHQIRIASQQPTMIKSTTTTSTKSTTNNKPKPKSNNNNNSSNTNPNILRRLESTLAASQALKSTEELLDALVVTSTTTTTLPKIQSSNSNNPPTENQQQQQPTPPPQQQQSSPTQPSSNKPKPASFLTTPEEIRSFITTSKQESSVENLQFALDSSEHMNDLKLVVLCHVELGLLLFTKEQLRESITHLRQALLLAKQIELGNKHVNVIATALQRAYLETGDKHNAKLVEQYKSITSTTTTTPTNPPITLPSQYTTQLQMAMKEALTDSQLTSLKLAIAMLVTAATSSHDSNQRLAIVNYQDALGVTPSMMACARGDLDFLIKLVRHGANLTLVDSTGASCLIWACRFGGKNVVQYLIDEQHLTFNVEMLTKEETESWLPEVVEYLQNKR